MLLVQGIFKAVCWLFFLFVMLQFTYPVNSVGVYCWSFLFDFTFKIRNFSFFSFLNLRFVSGLPMTSFDIDTL